MNGYDVIKKASLAVLSLCGEQEYSPNKEYRLSDYSVVVRTDNVILYHSCFSGELIVVNDEQLALPYLVKHWIFVDVDLDEKNRIHKIKRLMRLFDTQKSYGYKSFEIITTTTCNARCFYCYESLFPPMTMTSETAKKSVDFILSHRDINKKLKLKWYGGEPLMNIPAIDAISYGLNQAGILYSSSIISNGYLFSDDVINKAKTSWMLSNARITIDGTEDVYNRTKNYKGKGCHSNAYQVVLRNIDKLLDNNVSVTIRFNIESMNLEDNKRLISLLCDKYSGVKGIDFMLRPLNNTEADSNLESLGDDRALILEEIMKLKEQLFEDGFDVNCGKLSGVTTSTCIADSGKYIIIKPNGELAYCSADFDKKAYGSIFNDSKIVLMPDLSKNLIEKKPICDHCPIYPLCSPSKLCPASIHPICNGIQKEYNITDIKLTMKQQYRKYKLRDSYHET